MKKLIIYLAIVTIGVMGWTSYAGAAPECSKQDPCKTLENGKLCGDCAICGGCGEIKGGENCCVADAAKCSHCGFNAGSLGCGIKCSVVTGLLMEEETRTDFIADNI